MLIYSHGSGGHILSIMLREEKLECAEQRVTVASVQGLRGLVLARSNTKTGVAWRTNYGSQGGPRQAEERLGGVEEDQDAWAVFFCRLEVASMNFSGGIGRPMR